jgi:hypothetical protein
MGKKITIADIWIHGQKSVLVYCSNAPRCHHFSKVSIDKWPNNLSLSDLELRFVCTCCGRIGAEVRPDWDTEPAIYSHR